MITNVNEGVCQWRLTNNKPAFFVNWREDGEQQYEFFALRYQSYELYQRLKAQETSTL